jgi:GTP cyclohydrolase I
MSTITPLAEHRIDVATRAAADMLAALGLPVDDDGMRETPGRLVRAYAELLRPEPFRMTTFPNDEEYDELVLVRDVPVRSLCEHHMLPFTGVAHVGYLPSNRVVGLSKLARTVDLHSRGVQTQERLTTRVADHLQRALDPLGVGVVIEAEHTCMSLRGARAEGTRTVTARLLGRLRDDARSRAEFLALTRDRGERR